MPAIDTFAYQQTARNASIGPAEHAVLITPNDSTDLVSVTRAISIAVAGAVKITTLGGETVVIPSGALAPGVQHAIRITRIHATSTTATGIVAWY
jgi:hypothetical protein